MYFNTWETLPFQKEEMGQNFTIVTNPIYKAFAIMS